MRIDLDGLLEVAEAVGSPQALAGGIEPRAVGRAGEWAEMARLLKPFRDEAVSRLAAIRAEQSDDLVEERLACPGCRERRVDELLLNEDDVVCGTCGRRYSIAGEEGTAT